MTDPIKELRYRRDEMEAVRSRAARDHEVAQAKIDVLNEAIALFEKEMTTPKAATPTRQARGAVEAAVLIKLAGGVTAQFDDVVASTEMKPSSVKSCLDRLVKTGAIKLDDRGYRTAGVRVEANGAAGTVGGAGTGAGDSIAASVGGHG